MISFVVPFCTVEKDKFLNLNAGYDESDSSNVVFSTIKAIKSINSLKCDKEIILVDNSHTWPDIALPNVRVIKGWQAIPVEELKEIPEFMNHKDIQSSLDNFGGLTMWVSMAFHLGVQEAKGDYVVLQHNDVFYHRDCIDEMIQELNDEDLEYINVESKKISFPTYLLHKKMLDKFIKTEKNSKVKLRPHSGGYVETKDVGFADAYFFLCKREFFDNYNVDWNYGDTNHGATVFCLTNNLKFKHLGPYYDNPNWDIKHQIHTYHYKDKPFLTHLKGGFSEEKMSSKLFQQEFENYLKELSDVGKHSVG